MNNASLPDDGTPPVVEQKDLSSPDDPTDHIEVSLTIYDELVDMRLQPNDVDVDNSMQCPKIRRVGEMHLEIAKSLYCRVKQEAIKIKHKANSDGRKGNGIKQISKSIGDPAAKPLIFVKRDRDTEDGGKKGEITTNPKEVDAIVKRAWKNIYDGAGINVEAAISMFFEYFAASMYHATEFQVQDLDGEAVFSFCSAYPKNRWSLGRMATERTCQPFPECVQTRRHHVQPN